MLKHLALADEHYWFRSIIGGQSLDGFFPVEPNGDWIIGTDETAQRIFELYRTEIAEADRVLRSVQGGLEAPCSSPSLSTAPGEVRTHPPPVGYARVRLDTNGVLVESIARYERSGYDSIERYNDNPYAQRWFENRLSVG